tara:strand:- start:820 stop:1128 length:309 start_codon:yes stop_codon:yes gene_type:complete
MIKIETTSDSKKVLKQISTQLLHQKLTACTHIEKIPYSSYVWKKEIVTKKEYKLSIKALEKNEKKITLIIKKYHNYEVFDLLKQKITNLNPDYLKWFKKEIN